MRQHNGCQALLREAPGSIKSFVPFWFIWRKRSLHAQLLVPVHCAPLGQIMYVSLQKPEGTRKQERKKIITSW